MTWIWVTLYLGVGLVNVAHAGMRDILLLTNDPKRRSGSEVARHVEAMVEVVLYILLWPLQVLFWLCFGLIPAAMERLHDKTSGEK